MPRIFADSAGFDPRRCCCSEKTWSPRISLLPDFDVVPIDREADVVVVAAAGDVLGDEGLVLPSF